MDIPPKHAKGKKPDTKVTYCTIPFIRMSRIDKFTLTVRLVVSTVGVRGK